MKKVTDIVWELAEPVVKENGCELWDVEYVREAGQWYLRLYLDKEGGVDILDCEAVSRRVSDLLDEVDQSDCGPRLVDRVRHEFQACLLPAAAPWHSQGSSNPAICSRYPPPGRSGS